MSTSNALEGLSSCFITIPEYLHVIEITVSKQGRRFYKFVGCYLEKKRWENK
jgi:hypothetical protein